jgi:hypothetical protein
MYSMPVRFETSAQVFRRWPFAFGLHFVLFLKRVKNAVNVLARCHDLARWDVSKRARAVVRLVVTADVIAACIAAPERKIKDVGTVRIDFLAVRKGNLNLCGATAAVD